MTSSAKERASSMSLRRSSSFIFVVLDFPGEQLLSRSVQHMSPVKLLTCVDTRPGFVHHHLRSWPTKLTPSEYPADSSLHSELFSTSPISISGQGLLIRGRGAILLQPSPVARNSQAILGPFWASSRIRSWATHIKVGRNSRKFAVASTPAQSRPATLRIVPEERIARIGAPLATIEARQCYRPLRLATVQLPRGFLFLRPSTLMHERRGQTGSKD